jgi:bZIP transcription factor
VGAAETPLSEEEVQRRIRRVKNRESVEKCRNKQKMRLMALEHELNALRHENGMLLAVTKCVHGTYDVIATEVAAITGQRPALSC